MIQINYEKCIGCGKCVFDCQRRDIQMINGKAHPFNNTCMNCGHCVAVCPQNAVKMDDYNINDIKEYDSSEFDIQPDNLLNFIKFRRTIRHFKNISVENEKIEKVIDAGRFTPTGGNSQHISYIVVKRNIKELSSITMEALYNFACNYKNEGDGSNGLNKYINIWKQMWKDFISGNDVLFHNAPTMIILISNKEQALSPVVEESLDGGLAASNMELMANSLNLGVCYSGFFTFISDDINIREYLNISDNQKVVATMLLGYPDLKYIRTVPRRKPDIKWL